MYIRKTTKRYKDRVYVNYVLVESIHTPKGPRQKTICLLCDLEPRSKTEWLKLARKVERTLRGEGELFVESDPEAEKSPRRRKRRSRVTRPWLMSIPGRRGTK